MYTFTGRLQGIAIKLTNSNYLKMTDISFTYDSDPCTITDIPIKTLNDMTIEVYKLPVTQDIAFLFINSVAKAAGNSLLCGTNYVVSLK